jgi:hypothetical protein
MANPIVQRLIAAGASPARANAFAAQFAKSQPSLKTQDLEDAFDEQLGALSQTYFPNVFRPPAVDDPRFDDYAKFIYGPNALATIEKQVFAKNAPEFSKAKIATNYAKDIADYIEAGASLQQILGYINEDAENQTLNSTRFNKVDPNKTIKQAAADYASTLLAEYEKVAPAVAEAKTKIFENNKYYAVGLPDPKLKYGKTEDLSKGIISFKTHPQVEKYLAGPEASRAKQIASQPASSYMVDRANPQASIDAFKKFKQPGLDFEDNAFKEFSSSKANPLKDEISRREYLKDKTTR